MSKLYFKKEIAPENLIKIYEILGVEVKGKVAVKLHSGEDGNQNCLRPDFVKDLVEKLNETVVEFITAYPGLRTNNKDHKVLSEKHGLSKYYNVDIMDSEGDITLSIPNGKELKENYVCSHVKKHDSMLVLSHFKGHPLGGFGGALKQLLIDFASCRGKAYTHGAGTKDDASFFTS